MVSLARWAKCASLATVQAPAVVERDQAQPCHRADVLRLRLTVAPLIPKGGQPHIVASCNKASSARPALAVAC